MLSQSSATPSSGYSQPHNSDRIDSMELHRVRSGREDSLILWAPLTSPVYVAKETSSRSR